MITSIFPYSFANGDVMPCTVSQIPVVKDIKNSLFNQILRQNIFQFPIEGELSIRIEKGNTAIQYTGNNRIQFIFCCLIKNNRGSYH